MVLNGRMPKRSRELNMITFEVSRILQASIEAAKVSQKVPEKVRSKRFPNSAEPDPVNCAKRGKPARSAATIRGTRSR